MTKEKTTEQQVNELVTPYFQKLEKKLNRNFTKLELKLGNFYHLPVITCLGNYTKVPNDEPAFTLDPPYAGMVKDILKKNSDRNAIIIRRCIGYAAISRILVNPSLMPSYLNITITEMLLTLEKAIGFKYNTINAGIACYAKFERPEQSGIYFREIEDSAAFEIRLYSDTWSCIDLKEQND